MPNSASSLEPIHVRSASLTTQLRLVFFVCFTPDSDCLLRSSEMTRCAKSGHVSYLRLYIDLLLNNNR